MSGRTNSRPRALRHGNTMVVGLAFASFLTATCSLMVEGGLRTSLASVATAAGGLVVYITIFNWLGLFSIASSIHSQKRTWLARLHDHIRFWRRVPGTRYGAFKELVTELPELHGHIDELKHSIEGAEILPGDERFNFQVSSMRVDFKAYIRQFNLRRAVSFIRSLALVVLVLILTFAGLHISEYSLWGVSCFHDAIGEHLRTPYHAFADAAKALYFSAMTFCTLSFGDMLPAESFFDRLLTLAEAIACLFVLTVGLSYGLTLIQTFQVLDPDDLTEILEEEMNDAARALGGA